MRDDYIIFLSPEPGDPPRWMRATQGRVVRRGRGTDWLSPDEDAETGKGRAMVVLPPQATTLHWIACPGMTPRQGAAAARMMALEESIGDAGTLHAAAGASEDPEQPHVIAVASQTAMDYWLDWCVAHGISGASLVPAAMLLPAPDNGFVFGKIGDGEVVRGANSAFDADEPHAAIIVGDQPVMPLVPDIVDAALLAALDSPPLDLRQGLYARRAPALFDAARVKRILIMGGLIALVSLLIALITIIRLNAEAARLDQQTVTLARTIDPNVADAADADVKIGARLAERGGASGFTGTIAGIMTAMQANAGVTMSSVSQLTDGSLRVRLSASKAEEINDVLIAIQEAGWRISANAVQQQGGRLIADITVIRS